MELPCVPPEQPVRKPFCDPISSEIREHQSTESVSETEQTGPKKKVSQFKLARLQRQSKS